MRKFKGPGAAVFQQAWSESSAAEDQFEGKNTDSHAIAFVEIYHMILFLGFIVISTTGTN